jgi:hypothetical protein
MDASGFGFFIGSDTATESTNWVKCDHPREEMFNILAYFLNILCYV